MRTKIRTATIAAIGIAALGGQVGIADAATHKSKRHTTKHRTVARQTNAAGSTPVSSDAGSTPVSDPGNGGCHGGRGASADADQT